MRWSLAACVMTLCMLGSHSVAYGSTASLRVAGSEESVRAVLGAPHVSLSMKVTETSTHLFVGARLPQASVVAGVGRATALTPPGASAFVEVGVAGGALMPLSQVGAGVAVDGWLTTGWRSSASVYVAALVVPVRAVWGNVSGFDWRLPIALEVSARWRAGPVWLGVSGSGAAVTARGLGLSADGSVGVVVGFP